jgi:flagellin
MTIAPLGLNGLPQQQASQNASAKLQAIIARIVSGQKGNEDVAALSIASQLQASTSGLKQVASNIAQAASQTQVADGGVAQTQEVLGKLQSLASQAASPTLTPEIRSQLNDQFQKLASQLDHIANSTTFNGQKLLNGDVSGDKALSLDSVLASDTGDGNALSIADLSANGLLGGSLNLLTADSAQAAVTALGNAINTVTGVRADIGAFQSALDFSAANIDSAIANQDAARATLGETDIAEESTQLSLADLQRNASLAVTAQTNHLPATILQLIG